MMLACTMLSVETSAQSNPKNSNTENPRIPNKSANTVSSGRDKKPDSKKTDTTGKNEVGAGSHNSSGNVKVTPETKPAGDGKGGGQTKPAPTKPTPTKPKPNPGYSGGSSSQGGVSQGFFSISESDRNINSDSRGGERTIRVNCNAHSEWQISDYPAGWVDVDRDGNTLIFNIYANNGQDARHTSMSISGYNQGRWDTFTINFRQNGHSVFRALDLEFGNAADISDKNIAWGSQLISGNMRYLAARLVYAGPENREKKNLRIRIYRPDGTLERIPQSPEGYTWESKATISSGNPNYELLPLWGSPDRSNFPPGVYKYEVYDDNKLLLTRNVNIMAGAGQQSATIQDVTIEQNAVQNGVKGILVHMKLRAINLKGRQIRYCIFLLKSDGTPLRNAEGRQVSYQDPATPGYDDSTFNDWAIFIPYADLNNLGYSNLKFNIQVQDDIEVRLLSSSKGHSLGW